MSKYRDTVLKVLSDKKIKSTNEVLNEVQTISGKVINWHMIYRVLMELQNEGKVERIEAKVGFFWKRKG
jgi:Fe2+ or Zn2+ uptake regulation protein